MACLASFSFSSPLGASQGEIRFQLSYCSTPLSASLQGKTACPTFSNFSSLANKKSVGLGALNRSHGRIGYQVTWGYGRDRLTCRTQQPLCLSCIVTVNQSTQAIISGYWSGPDAEDGWGFVEAYVDRAH